MESKKIPHVARDIIQYIMIPRIRYAREIGTYASYDIAAYNSFARGIVAIVPDVSTDRNTVLHIVELFNRHQLSYIHLEEAINDMLS